MKALKIVLSASLVTLLSACGNQFQASKGITNASSSSGAQSTPTPTPVVNNSAAQKMMSELQTSLKQQSATNATGSQKLSLGELGLSSSQINVILTSAALALANNNLSNSNDLSKIIPVLIQGATAGVGGLNLSNMASVSGLLSLIGDSTLNSLINQSGDTVSTDLIKQITSSLFGNLGVAGVTDINKSTVVSSVINALLSKLASKDVDVDSIKTVIASLASGSVLGIGNLGTSNALLQTILGSLGSGSLGGLTSLIGNLGGNNSNSTTLQTLINAFTSGSQSGLVNLAGAAVGSSNPLVGTLLQAVLGGIGHSAGSTGNTAATTIVSSLLNLLIGKI